LWYSVSKSILSDYMAIEVSMQVSHSISRIVFYDALPCTASDV